MRYNVTPEWSLSLGGKYFKFGDAQAQLPTKDKVGNFDSNDGYAFMLSLLITPNNLMLNHTKCPKYKNSLNFQAIFY